MELGNTGDDETEFNNGDSVIDSDGPEGCKSRLGVCEGESEDHVGLGSCDG